MIKRHMERRFVPGHLKSSCPSVCVPGQLASSQNQLAAPDGRGDDSMVDFSKVPSSLRHMDHWAGLRKVAWTSRLGLVR